MEDLPYHTFHRITLPLDALLGTDMVTLWRIEESIPHPHLNGN